MGLEIFFTLAVATSVVFFFFHKRVKSIYSSAYLAARDNSYIPLVPIKNKMHYMFNKNPSFYPHPSDQKEFVFEYLPTLFISILWTTLYIPIVIAKLCINYFRYGTWDSISDIEIFELLTSGSIIIFLKIDAEKDTLIFEIPPEVDSRVPFAGLRVEMDIRSKKLLSATQNGRSLLDRKGLVFRWIHLALCYWIHPKIHALAERSAEEIRDKKIESLYFSQRFVSPLHFGLFQGWVSPINPRLIYPIHSMPLDHKDFTKNTIYNLIEVELPHRLHPKKMEFPVYRFFLHSRAILKQCLIDHKIDVNLTNLFANMIMHSTDHTTDILKVNRLIYWPMSHQTLLGHIQSAYWKMWSSPKDSNFYGQNQKIKDIPEPFYQDLYQQLATVNVRLANEIRASCSW